MNRKQTHNKSFVHTAAAALLLTVLAQPIIAVAADAADFPGDRPITLVVPYPPGGSNDTFARAVGMKLGTLLKTTVVIENKGGAGGSIGTMQVARAKPDGYTLAAVSSSFTTNAAIQPTLPFDPIKDLRGVGLMAEGPFILAARKSLGITKVADLIDYAKTHPGQLNYSSSGPGSSNQFATEMMNSLAKIKMTHVPFKGMGPATNALIGDQVDVLIASGPSLLPAVGTGKAIALGVTSSEKSQVAPDLPTIATDVPGYNFKIWWGILAPRGTPDAIVNKLNDALKQVTAEEELKKFFLKEGAEAAYMTAQDFDKEISDNIALWKKVAKDSDIHVQK